MTFSSRNADHHPRLDYLHFDHRGLISVSSNDYLVSGDDAAVDVDPAWPLVSVSQTDEISLDISRTYDDNGDGLLLQGSTVGKTCSIDTIIHS